MTIEMKCPVCGEEVAGDLFSVEFEGQKQVFCCAHCRARFIEDREWEFVHSNAHAVSGDRDE